MFLSIALAKDLVNDLSIKVLEYPEITTPEQGLENGLARHLCYLCKKQQ